MPDPMKTTKSPSLFRIFGGALKPIKESLTRIEDNTKFLRPDAPDPEEDVENKRATKKTEDTETKQTGLLAKMSGFLKDMKDGKGGGLWSAVKKLLPLLAGLAIWKMPMEWLPKIGAGLEMIWTFMKEHPLLSAAAILLGPSGIMGLAGALGSIIMSALGTVGITSAMLLGAKALGIAGLIGGITLLIKDAILGWTSEQGSKKEKFKNSFAFALGGKEGGSIKNAFTNAAKWGGIGAGLGLASGTGIIGVIAGGILGFAIGGILGWIGGPKIKEWIDGVEDTLNEVWAKFGRMWDGITGALSKRFDKAVNKMKSLISETMPDDMGIKPGDSAIDMLAKILSWKPFGETKKPMTMKETQTGSTAGIAPRIPSDDGFLGTYSPMPLKTWKPPTTPHIAPREPGTFGPESRLETKEQKDRRIEESLAKGKIPVDDTIRHIMVKYGIPLKSFSSVVRSKAEQIKAMENLSGSQFTKNYSHWWKRRFPRDWKWVFDKKINSKGWRKLVAEGMISKGWQSLHQSGNAFDLATKDGFIQGTAIKKSTMAAALERGRYTVHDEGDHLHAALKSGAQANIEKITHAHGQRQELSASPVNFITTHNAVAAPTQASYVMTPQVRKNISIGV